MRLRKTKDADIRLHEYAGIVVFNANEYKGKWEILFQNNNPIYIEIGMGKGKFILNHAINNPNINYIGIEKETSITLKAAQRVSKSEIHNLLLLNIDAINIKDYFENDEISKIYLNFSDPWPKSRHTKRRLTYNSNLNNYKDILKIDSTIEFKTDNRKMFEYSLITFIQNKWEIEDLSLNLHEDKENIITTEYEDKFVLKNNIIYYLEVKNGKNENV